MANHTTQDSKTRVMDPNADHRWKIGGKGGIEFDDLELVGLQHVSAASWQVHLRCIKNL